MSRVGKKPIPVPEKTDITYADGKIIIKGAKGSLTETVHPSVDLKIEDGIINVIPKKNDRQTRAYQGLVRSLVANMVTGVTNGFERVLEINGIGYRAEVGDDTIVFHLGYSNPVQFKLPQGITAAVEKNTIIKLAGIDKQLLGHTAASIRSLRPVEPYKGKGIKYKEETVRKKAGKSGAK